MRPLLLPLLLPLLRGGAGLRARVDDEVHVATVACGFYCPHAVNLTITFLAQAKLEGGPKPTLHVFHDGSRDDCAERFASLSASEPVLFAAGNVILHDASKELGATPGSDNGGKRCNCLRIYLPRLFPGLRKLMYLDADTLVVDSIRQLFRLPMKAYMIGEDGGANYNYPDTRSCPSWRGNGSKILEGDRCHPFQKGLNDGVYLMDLDQWRAHNVDAEFEFWMQQINSGAANFPFNDQDIFNVVSVRHPEFWTPLPCEANSLIWSRWMCYYGNGTHDNFTAKDIRRNDRQPIILHNKFGYAKGSQQWIFMRDQVMAAVDRVRRGADGGARSLCDMASCGRWVAEKTYHDDCWGHWPDRVVAGVKCAPRTTEYVERDLDEVRQGKFLYLRQSVDDF